MLTFYLFDMYSKHDHIRLNVWSCITIFKNHTPFASLCYFTNVHVFNCLYLIAIWMSNTYKYKINFPSIIKTLENILNIPLS